MWTVDSQCSRCTHKETCEDRKAIIANQTELAGRLNTEERFVTSTGDGLLVMVCHDFATA